LIIKTEDFELEISTGTDVYFASKKLGQNFKKWDDLEDNEKLKLGIIQKKVERLILESKEILSAKEIADNFNRDRRSGIKSVSFRMINIFLREGLARTEEAESIEG
jgi:hypothetical protein